MIAVKRYRKRPVVIEAVLLTNENQLQVASWCGGMCRLDEGVDIDTLEGVMTAQISDYVIKGTHGEFYPVKPDIFKANYEEVLDGKEAPPGSTV